MLLLLERITKLNLESQNSNLRLFARVDIITKLDILEQQRHIFHKLKQQYLDIDKTVLTLSSLILAIDLKVNSTDAVTLNAIKLRATKQKRNTSKREKLLGMWAIIRILKLDQNMSYRQICEYLKKYHKLEVAHSLIHNMWIELEK
jgi:hypothetical protein